MWTDAHAHPWTEGHPELPESHGVTTPRPGATPAPVTAPGDSTPASAVRRMWCDTVAHGHAPALRAAADPYGAGRPMLGTGFPHQTGDQSLRAVSFIPEAPPAAEGEAVPTAGERLPDRSPSPGPVNG